VTPTFPLPALPTDRRGTDAARDQNRLQFAPRALLNGTLADCANAIAASYERLHTAAKNAEHLLALSGNAGMRGDTADDLAVALAVHGYILQQFQVKVKTDHQVVIYTTAAGSSFSAYTAAADRQGDMPCSITVMRAAQSAAASLS
jgi:hypothetical protein